MFHSARGDLNWKCTNLIEFSNSIRCPHSHIHNGVEFFFEGALIFLCTFILRDFFEHSYQSAFELICKLSLLIVFPKNQFRFRCNFFHNSFSKRIWECVVYPSSNFLVWTLNMTLRNPKISNVRLIALSIIQTLPTKRYFSTQTLFTVVRKTIDENKRASE